MRPPSRTQVRLYLWIVAASISISAPYGYFDALAHGGSGGRGIVRGAIAGFLIAAAIGAIELFLLDGVLRARVRRMPFALHMALRSGFYAAIIVGGLAAGPALVPGTSGGIRLPSVLLAMALSVGFNVVVGANQLLGPRVLFKFVSGRYHRPRIEERVLLFIDLESSTQIAERLGELRFLDFLNRFFGDVTDAIAAEGGEIHKYVGDEVIAAWPVDGARAAERAVRACFAALHTLARRAHLYEAEFGASANFRAGLHAGPVVLGELGYIKMEIALLGDTMNTAARIHELCRETGNRVIASDALIARTGQLPPGIQKRPLGPIALRGKERALQLYALAAR